MARKKDRSPKELARREKIRELLELANVGSIQNCIIHQLRNSTKYVTYKDLKELMLDANRICW